jgi:hypothetical protein
MYFLSGMQAIHEYTDAEKALADNLVHIHGAGDASCSMTHRKPSITISARKSPLTSAATSPTRLKDGENSGGGSGDSLVVVSVGFVLLF